MLGERAVGLNLIVVGVGGGLLIWWHAEVAVSVEVVLLVCLVHEVIWHLTAQDLALREVLRWPLPDVLERLLLPLITF